MNNQYNKDGKKEEAENAKQKTAQAGA